MATSRDTRRKALADKLFTNISMTKRESQNENVNSENDTQNKKQLWDRLWRALKQEQSKWWEATTLQKYMDCVWVPRGLRIFVTPTFLNPDPDLIEEWAMNNHNCSTIMLKLLIKYAKKDIECLTAESEKIMESLRSKYTQIEFENEMKKLNIRLEKVEEGIKAKKQQKFYRDQIDYEKAQIPLVGSLTN